MANLKGEVTFKVTFNNLGVPAGLWNNSLKEIIKDGIL